MLAQTAEGSHHPDGPSRSFFMLKVGADIVNPNVAVGDRNLLGEGLGFKV